MQHGAVGHEHERGAVPGVEANLADGLHALARLPAAKLEQRGHLLVVRERCAHPAPVAAVLLGVVRDHPEESVHAGRERRGLLLLRVSLRRLLLRVSLRRLLLRVSLRLLLLRTTWRAVLADGCEENGESCDERRRHGRRSTRGVQRRRPTPRRDARARAASIDRIDRSADAAQRLGRPMHATHTGPSTISCGPHWAHSYTSAP